MVKQRIIHIRPPLLVSRTLNGRPVSPEIHADRMNTKGGCTVVLSPTDNGEVAVRVAWCNRTDSYDRKLGVKTALEKSPYYIKPADVVAELVSIEDQMMCQLSSFLLKWAPLRKELALDLTFAGKFFPA